jgi:hypothetical protein
MASSFALKNLADGRPGKALLQQSDASDKANARIDLRSGRPA